MNTFSLHATAKIFQEPDKIDEEPMPTRKLIKKESKTDLRTKVVEMEPFLVGLSPSTVAFKLGNKLSRLLNKYRSRKHQRELRQEDWNRLYESKPVEGVNHPDDVKALKVAAATIGDFKLKSAETYKVPPSMRESTVSKYQQLLEARLRSCKYMVSSFNAQVLDLRNRKIRLIQHLGTLKLKIDVIHEEIPECRIKQPPAVPMLTDADFPEKEMEVQLTVEEDFQEYLNNLKPRKDEPEIDICGKIDWEKETLGIDRLPDIPGTSRDIILQMSLKSEAQFSPFKKKIPSKDDCKETHWEKEIKYRRLLKKLYEQDTMIAKMNTLIAEFDESVKKLSEERFMITMKYTLLDLHILVLNQELIIVKDFEVVEDELGSIALQKWNEMMDMRDDMKRVELKIETHNYNIENCQEQIKVLQQTFMTAAKDNKFWDFLRRIFKKKYRPPKLATDDSDSSSASSSSSSESEDDDAGSLDSRDIGPIRLDESILPKGCDKELYDYTFVLRGRRHEQERQIAEEKKSIETCKKDLEHAAKKMKIYDHANKKAQDELEKYQMLKQKTLNEVNCLIILKLSQLRHINPDGYSVAKLSETLVFRTERLTKLYNRVTELQMETLEERTKHKKNKIHLHRMSVDCRHMNKTITKLKKDITEKMIIKFGSRVKIDDIEESILKRMVLNLRMRMLNLGSAYEKEIDKLRKNYGEKQTEVKNIIRENTARLEVLAILNKEKAQLAKLLDLQARTMAKAKNKDDLYFIKDIDKLEAVAKSQQEQIQMIKLEIKMLTTKSLPPKPIPHEIEEKVPEPELPSLVGDYGSLDDLYEPPEFRPPEQLIVMPLVDQEVTEEEIVICIHELMKEVVDAVVETDLKDTEEGMIIKILSEIIDQVPVAYLGKQTSLEYISGLIKDIISDVTKIESDTIIKKISKATSRSIEEIAGVVESIISKVTENEVTKEQATERTEETEKTEE